MQDYKDEKKYYPTLVSEIQGIKDVDSFNKVKKIKVLPQKSQDILFSDQIVEFIYDVERRYYLQDEMTEEFSRTVRAYFLREITLEGFVQKVSQICKISAEEANRLLQSINNIVVNKEGKQKQQNVVKLKFSEIINKYPKILNQIITNKVIITKPFLQPLKPTIKNWIMVYEKILGVSIHTMIERGDFVFRAEATKGLDEGDRKKLLALFKARDEDGELFVNTDDVEVAFEYVEKSNITKKRSDRSKPVITPNPEIENNLNEIQIENHFQKGLQQNNTKLKTTTHGGMMDMKKQGKIKGVQTTKQSIVNKDMSRPVATQIVNSGVYNDMKVVTEVVDTKNTKLNTRPVTVQNNNKIQNQALNVSPQIQIEDEVLNDLKKEIEKNRIEMGQIQNNGLQSNVAQPSLVDTKRHPTVSHKNKNIKIIKDTSTTNNIKTEIQPIITQNIQKKSNTTGTISFSSNHVMPAEKTHQNKVEKEKVVKQQVKHIKMKPMGYPHDLSE